MMDGWKKEQRMRGRKEREKNERRKGRKEDSNWKFFQVGYPVDTPTDTVTNPTPNPNPGNPQNGQATWRDRIKN